MAICKVYFRKDAESLIHYVFSHTQEGDVADSESCPPSEAGAAEEFKILREHMNFKDGNNQAVHVIQSWDESDSQKLTAQQVNAMGRKLVEDHFKGHQFVIVTHTETGKFHNHIVLNTVNMETGKLIDHKYRHLHELRKINDRICLERGLKIPNQDATLRRANAPKRVQAMKRANNEAWIMDIKNKADLSRSLATSYDQYVDYMDALGIRTWVSDKNISYFYPGRSRGKRGDSIGKPYDKPGLEEQFKSNDERFHGRVQKDYSSFTKTDRRTMDSLAGSLSKTAGGIISSDEIRRAKRSILEYCNDNHIKTARNAKGETVLFGKEYIVINDTEARNKRNGTRATLIDFVAAHNRLTLLQSVAKINGSPHLTAFEQQYGAVQRKYTPFYVPKPEQMPLTQATQHLSHFLKAHGADFRLSHSLLKDQRAEVMKDGVIHLFAESDQGGSLSFKEGPGNAWSEKKQGRFQNPFYKRSPRRKTLYLFSSPQSYLSRHRGESLSDRKHTDGILVLMEPNAKIVDQYLNQHKQVQKVHLFTQHGPGLSKSELDFFGILKQKLATRGIEISTTSHEKSVRLEGPSLGF